MANIKQGTTPTLVITLTSEVELSSARLFLTLSQGGKSITKNDGITIDGQKISVYLTQADTIWLNPSAPVKIDLNWVYEDGSRGGIVPVEIPVIESLLKGVIR